MRKMQKIKCAECGTPVAEVQGNELVIRTQHHGREHITVLSLLSLVKGERDGVLKEWERLIGPRVLTR